MNENQHDPGPQADRPDPSAPQSGQAEPTDGHPTTTDSGPRVSGAEVRDLARLRRSSTDRHVAGVAGGLARHLDIDPVILRVAFVVLAFFGGAGLLLYGALWLLVPEEDSGRATIDVDPRSRSVALVAVGVLAVLISLGDWGGWWFPWPLLLIGLVAWLVLSRRDRSPAAPTSATDPATGRPVATGGAAPGTTSHVGWAGEPPTVARPRDPKKRGPVLFWFTVALAALALGTLGIVDLAGAPIVDAAYPALALGTIAAMLLVGAFWGRAGGLILLGLVALVALAGTTAGDRWAGEQVLERPASAAEVEEEYRVGAGELVLDLRDLRDPEGLDGQSIDLEVGTGRIVVLLPDDLGAQVDAEVGGPGHIELFGDETGGINVNDSGRVSGGTSTLEIDAFAGVGEIKVEQR